MTSTMSLPRPSQKSVAIQLFAKNNIFGDFYFRRSVGFHLCPCPTRFKNQWFPRWVGQGHSQALCGLSPLSLPHPLQKTMISEVGGAGTSFKSWIAPMSLPQKLLKARICEVGGAGTHCYFCEKLKRLCRTRTFIYQVNVHFTLRLEGLRERDFSKVSNILEKRFQSYA